MMGQNILCNNVLKLIANRNKCVNSISYDFIKRSAQLEYIQGGTLGVGLIIFNEFDG